MSDKIEKHKKNLDAYGEITDGVIVCPHCFLEDDDCFEYRIGDGQGVEIECGDCLRKFLVTKDITVDYTSRKLP